MQQGRVLVVKYKAVKEDLCPQIGPWPLKPKLPRLHGLHVWDLIVIRVQGPS